MQPDHYLALGITADASPADVRAAYLRVMRASHPDRHPDDAAAAETARAANAAWEVLGDAARRGAYDRLREHRGDGTVRHAVHVVRSDVDETRVAAYRAQAHAFSREVHVASLKFGALVFLLGLLALFGTLR